MTAWKKRPIVGRKFGTLTVQSATGPRVTVRCDCGREREVDSRNLYRSPTCGDRSAHPRKPVSTQKRRPDSIIGRRFGMLVVLASAGGIAQVECDCGRTTTVPSNGLHRLPTCGDHVRHPNRTPPSDRLSVVDRYRYCWHKERAACEGWSEFRTFAAEVGEQPSRKHCLVLLQVGPLACGSCSACRAAGASRNVVWARGAPARAGVTLVLLDGELYTQAAAARRLKITREGVRQRLLRGTLIAVTRLPVPELPAPVPGR